MKSHSERAAFVREIAETAFFDAIEILTLIEIMEAQNNGQINDRLSEAGAGRAGIVARNALISRIAILVMSAFAPVRHKDDKHLARAFELLKDPAVRAIAGAHGDPASIDEAEQRWTQLRRDPRLPAFKHFRDKRTAHVTNAVLQPLSYTEFFGFAHDAIRVAEKAAHAVGATSDTLDEIQSECAGSAAALWRPWNR